MEQNRDFKPYIPANRVLPEVTGISVGMGVFLAVVFGAANAYLGLRVGMTVSASIPAAVVSMGVIRKILRRDSILESNLVQTIGSAGESVAAGAIFTLPALFLWAAEGAIPKPGIVEITLIALAGGLLGVFFMIPLRNALIVKEHGVLPYPEGTACAKVLLAGEEKGANASSVFFGMGFAAIYKLIIDGFQALPGEISFRFKSFAGEIGTQVYPAVMSVGFICGWRIASYMFAGGVLSWLVMIPMMVRFGQHTVLYPGVDQSVAQMYASGGAGAIWSAYIRYIGAGALAAGGIISLLKSLPLILVTFRDALFGFRDSRAAGKLRTEQELRMPAVLLAVLALTLAVWLLPAIPISLIGAVVVVVFGFFFAAVSSRMVGLVGSSNNPVSGMTIATLLIAALVLKITGDDGARGMTAAIAIGSIICIVAAVSGDTSQDLKTGFLLGATPKKQQIGELIGVVVSALAIGSTLYLLDRAWGFGSEELAAPQATLMKLMVEGVMNAQLPWELLWIGVFVAVAVEVIGIPVLPVAIGIYLPVSLSACVMAGGLVRLAVEHSKQAAAEKQAALNDGILYCSGMIAGEGLAGIFLAVLAIVHLDTLLDISGFLHLPAGGERLLSLGLFAVMIYTVFKCSIWKKRRQ